MAELFHEVLHDPPHVNIGKNGITENVVKHILELIKTKKILKIKILKETAHLIGVDTIITQLQERCHLVILDVRGFTMIVGKKHIPGIRGPKKYNLSDESNLISPQDSSLESSIIEEGQVSAEILITPSKSTLNSSPDEPIRLEQLESPPLATSLQLNPEYIDFDNLELMTELDHLEESVQTTRQSIGKITHPRSSSIHGKKQSKNITRKYQSSSKTHMKKSTSKP